MLGVADCDEKRGKARKRKYLTIEVSNRGHVGIGLAPEWYQVTNFPANFPAILPTIAPRMAVRATTKRGLLVCP